MLNFTSNITAPCCSELSCARAHVPGPPGRGRTAEARAPPAGRPAAVAARSRTLRAGPPLSLHPGRGLRAAPACAPRAPTRDRRVGLRARAAGGLRGWPALLCSCSGPRAPARGAAPPAVRRARPPTGRARPWAPGRARAAHTAGAALAASSLSPERRAGRSAGARLCPLAAGASIAGAGAPARSPRVGRGASPGRLWQPLPPAGLGDVVRVCLEGAGETQKGAWNTAKARCCSDRIMERKEGNRKNEKDENARGDKGRRWGLERPRRARTVCWEPAGPAPAGEGGRVSLP